MVLQQEDIMSCSRKKRKVSALQNPRDEITDFIPVINKKGVPKDCNFLDHEICLKGNQWDDGALMPDEDNASPSVDSMGFAYGLKFLKKGEEPDLTCAPTADAFNRTVEIPRVYDVAIPEIQLAPSRPVVDIGMHGFGSRGNVHIWRGYG